MPEELKELRTIWKIMTDKPLEELTLTLEALLLTGAETIHFLGKGYKWLELKKLWELSKIQ